MLQTSPQTVLEGASLKAVRAYGLLTTISETARSYLEDNDSHGALRWNSDGTASSFYRKQEPLSPMLGVLAGEYVHNLRSALDNLIAYLIFSSGGQPLRHHAFPVCLSRDQWIGRVESPGRGRPSPLSGLAPADEAAVRRCQPFVGRDAADAEGAPLAVLHRMWNADKHVALHGVLTYVPRHEQTIIRAPRGVGVEIVWQPPPGTHIQDGQEMTRLRFRGRVPRKVGVGINWPLGVMLTDYQGRSIATGRPLQRLLFEVLEVLGIWDPKMREFRHQLGVAPTMPTKRR